MKTIVFLTWIVLIGTGCVLTPYEGNLAVDAGYEPRVYTSSRSAVTVWLHPNYAVADAYPIAQSHCSRWGLWAQPARDWDYSTSSVRYLDYTCVGSRPNLAYPHYYRGGRGHRGSEYGHKRRVFTPKPEPRYHRRGSDRSHSYNKRRTFGEPKRDRPHSGRKEVVTERGKPWEHNANKRPITNRRDVVTERGKPWERNRNKRSINDNYDEGHRSSPSKRRTFGEGSSHDSSFKGTRGNVKSKTVKKGTLSL